MVESNCLANHRWVGVETSLPQAVADDGHRMSTGSLIFFRQERAAPDRIDTQQLEVVAGNSFTKDLFYIFRATKFELLDAISSQSRKNFVLLTKNQKVLVSTGLVRMARIADIKFNQLFRLSHRTRAK